MFTFASLSASNLRLGEFYNVSNYPSLNKTLGEFKARRKRTKITQGENDPVFSSMFVEHSRGDHVFTHCNVVLVVFNH